MKIPQLDGGKGHESVLWDTACSSIFMRTEHTERMKFPCKEKRLCVRTLGGVQKEIDSKIYNCHIRDWKGRIY